jgi:hypothetical protein
MKTPSDAQPRVILFDTTLRDGAASLAALTPVVRATIAGALVY